jgi:hypothetical protein
MDIKQQTNIHFSKKKGMLITILGQDFSYIIESLQQLKEQNLLVTGRRI